MTEQKQLLAPPPAPTPQDWELAGPNAKAGSVKARQDFYEKLSAWLTYSMNVLYRDVPPENIQTCVKHVVSRVHTGKLVCTLSRMALDACKEKYEAEFGRVRLHGFHGGNSFGSCRRI